MNSVLNRDGFLLGRCDCLLLALVLFNLVVDCFMVCSTAVFPYTDELAYHGSSCGATAVVVSAAIPFMTVAILGPSLLPAGSG